MLKKHVISLLWVALCLVLLPALVSTMAYRNAIHLHDDGSSVAFQSHSDLKTTQEFRSDALLQGAEHELEQLATADPVSVQHTAMVSRYLSRSPRRIFHSPRYKLISGGPVISVTQSRAPPPSTTI